MQDVRLNKNGLNANIKAHILPDDKMYQLGFTDCSKNVWYFHECWGDIEISFNVRIPKDNPKDLKIDVLDEYFLQPYDYQYILSRIPDQKVALMVKNRVNKCMTHLIDGGVLSGWKVGDYL